MKRMSYGTMPSREEFNREFNRECPDGYEISMPHGSGDLITIETALEDIIQFRGEEIPTLKIVKTSVGMRSAWTFTSDQLWTLLEVLCKMDIPRVQNITLHEDHWPLNLASSILSTLGFEWI